MVKIIVSYFSLIIDDNISVLKPIQLSVCHIVILVEMDYTGNYMFKRELLTRGNVEPGHSTELSKYGTNFSDATALVDSVSIYKLPVGVRHLEKLEDTPLMEQRGAAWRVDDDEKKQNHAGPSMSWSGLTDTNFNNKVSSFNKGNCTGNSKKQGVLSVRAASMLVNFIFPYAQGTHF